MLTLLGAIPAGFARLGLVQTQRTPMKWFGSAVTCFALAATAWLARAATSPLSPNDERATFQLADTSLTIELAAAEPQIRAPVAIAWDADGRMFVAEMTDYPSGPVNGRIRLLEDRDGDGRYESSTVFATNLAYPNGVMAWRNGVLITAAPDIWFLADTNADGVADVREKILTGFTEGNQQLRVNGLYWGIDNWIYGCNGRSDGEVRWADGTTAGSIRRHDFRFRPDTKEFEVIAGNSQFGMGHDDWGNRFPVFNNTPIRHVVIENHYLVRQPSLAGMDNVPNISPTNDGNRVFALTPPNLLIPQPIGFFTSACGPSVFRGTALPASYYGNYFVCEPVQNVVQRRVLKLNGSTFVAEYAHTNKEFLASSDRWFHGVFTATGPDGALYIVDFYRDLVEHPHWVAPELRDKIDWRKGEEHGRIWRVRAKDRKLARVEKLSRAPNADLVKAVKTDNGWTRDTAHRLLVERNSREVAGLLIDLCHSTNSSLAHAHALNLLGAFKLLSDEHVAAALRDPDPRLREQAVRLSEGVGDRAERILAPAGDADARVRLQAVCTLGELDHGSLALRCAAQVAEHPELDRWQSLAILSCVSATNSFALLSRLLGLVENGTDEQLWLLERLCGFTLTYGRAAEGEQLARWISRSQSANRLRLAAAFVQGMPAHERDRGLERLGGQPLFQECGRVCTNSAAPAPLRIAALHIFAEARATNAAAGVQALLNQTEPEFIQSEAVRTLMFWPAPFPKLSFDYWTVASKTVRRAIVRETLRDPALPTALFDRMEGGEIRAAEIDPVARDSYLKHRDPAIKRRAEKTFAANVSADRQAVVETFRGALKLAGDRKHGAELFERTCAVCHQMQGVGAMVGPDLSSIGQHARESLLVDILDPSRQVLPDFVSYVATLRNGDTVTGFIANELSGTVTLRRANEPDVTLDRVELKDFRTEGRSLMPDGLEAGMNEQDMADLIEFLRRPDRTLFTHAK